MKKTSKHKKKKTYVKKLTNKDLKRANGGKLGTCFGGTCETNHKIYDGGHGLKPV
jgi:hypothetical protein